MTTATETSYMEIETGRLRPSPLNRKHFDAQKFEELLASVAKDGVRTPLIVRPVAGGAFEIGAGERRFRAAMKAGLPKVPAIIRPMTDAEFLEFLTFENGNRDDLHPLDEAEMFQRLLEQIPAETEKAWTPELLADKRGVSPGYVYLSLRRLKLVKLVREAFLKGEIVAGHADDIARLAPDDQLEALKYSIGKHAAYRNERLSVRELRDVIQRYIVRDLAKAPFDTKDAELLITAGACGPCPKRAANNPELFGEIAKGDRCMDGSCFTQKTELWLDAIRAKAKADGHKVVDLKTGYDPGKGLASEKWQRAGAKECDHYAAGVVVAAGFGQEKVGDRINVCLKPRECKVHNPKTAASRSSSSSRSSTSSPAAAKQDVQGRIDRKVFELLRHKIKTPLTKPDLVVLVANELKYGDGEEIIAEAYGWKVADLRNEKTAVKLLDKLSANDLSRLLIEQKLAFEVADGYHRPITDALVERYGIDRKKAFEVADGYHRPITDALVERYGIDRKKVAAELQIQDAIKANALKGAKTPAPKKKAKSR